jgi:phosphohistidine phosphatase SixA
MKTIFLLFLFMVCVQFDILAQGELAEGKTVVVVRHAERNPGRDSTLTAEGYIRAGDLYRRVKDIGISKIYVTPYIRSFETADSLRIYAQLDTVQYKPDLSGKGLTDAITLNRDWDKHLLVVAHSNTLAPVLRSLGIDFQGDAVSEDEFDSIFFVSRENGRLILRREKYGAANNLKRSEH